MVPLKSCWECCLVQSEARAQSLCWTVKRADLVSARPLAPCPAPPLCSSVLGSVLYSGLFTYHNKMSLLLFYWQCLCRFTCILTSFLAHLSLLASQSILLCNFTLFWKCVFQIVSKSRPAIGKLFLVYLAMSWYLPKRVWWLCSKKSFGDWVNFLSVFADRCLLCLLRFHCRFLRILLSLDCLLWVIPLVSGCF